MTRRIQDRHWQVGETYAIRDRWFRKAQGYILITRRFRQRLGDISEEDARKEGCRNTEDFKALWAEINGSWQPDMQVTVYEFKTTRKVDCPNAQIGGLPH